MADEEIQKTLYLMDDPRQLVPTRHDDELVLVHNEYVYERQLLKKRGSWSF